MASVTAGTSAPGLEAHFVPATIMSYGGGIVVVTLFYHSFLMVRGEIIAMMLGEEHLLTKERKAMNKVKIRMMGSTSSIINNCIMSY